MMAGADIDPRRDRVPQDRHRRRPLTGAPTAITAAQRKEAGVDAVAEPKAKPKAEAAATAEGSA